MHDNAQVVVLSPDDSTFWRQAYLDAFVDTSSDHYRRYIATRREFSDGNHYEGYLWDCLRSQSIVTEHRVRQEVSRHQELLVMADDHSRDRIIHAPLWPYGPGSVARMSSQSLLESMERLPEDIYIFDESVSWTLVRTHEHDDRRRFCCAIGIET